MLVRVNDRQTAIIVGKWETGIYFTKKVLVD